MTLKTPNFLATRFALVLFGILLLAPGAALFASAKDSQKDTNTQRAFADTSALERMAESAQCAAEHAEVARGYRLRAEQLEAKAVKHEKNATELEARPKGPMHHKWPAMAQKPWAKERDMAMQARRAANESQLLADKHLRLGMENITASCSNAMDSAVGN
ncbi:MAG: hypothetical protein KIT83_20145 [Bryobacterales bacterium]|nr:hypothetical protein [Bryobacterales bacterium]